MKCQRHSSMYVGVSWNVDVGFCIDIVQYYADIW